MEFFKRKNSFGISYLSNEKADIDDVCEILEKLNISVEDVYGVQQVNLRKIIVKLEDCAADVFDKVIKDYEGRVFSLEKRNVSIQIINLSSTKTVVTVKNVPFEVANDSLMRILGEYGEVYNIRSQVYTEGVLSGKNNGNRTALMKIIKPIPSSIVFRRFSLLIYYRGQIRTCHKCGLAGHMAVDCSISYGNVVSRFNESEFPSLGENNYDSRVPHEEDKGFIQNRSLLGADSAENVESEEISVHKTMNGEDSNDVLEVTNFNEPSSDVGKSTNEASEMQFGEQTTLGVPTSGNEQSDGLGVISVNVDVHCTQGSYLDLEKVTTLENQDAVHDCTLEEEEEEEKETGNSASIMECEEEKSSGDIKSDCDQDSEDQWEIVGKHKKRKVIKKYNMRNSSRNKLKLKVLSSKRSSLVKDAVMIGKHKNMLSHDKIGENSSGN